MKMTFKYILMAAAISPVFGAFISCSDNDEPEAIVEIKPNEIEISSDWLKVKIDGEDVLVPITEGAGEYTVYSLNPGIVEVYKGTDGNYYVKGVTIGETEVVAADAANQFKRVRVSSYVNPTVEFNIPSVSINPDLGHSIVSEDVKITLGNGKYRVESDNENVRVSIEEGETGKENSASMKIAAQGLLDPYTATITITDNCGFSSSFQVNVSSNVVAFTNDDLNELAASTETAAYIDFHGEPDWHLNYYWRYNTDSEMSEWVNTDNDGTTTFGWWMTYGGDDSYGGHKITYPTSTQVGKEIAGNYLWQYSWWEWYSKHTIPGTVKVLRDDETAKIVVWWNVDLEHAYLEKGYIIKFW